MGLWQWWERCQQGHSGWLRRPPLLLEALEARNLLSGTPYIYNHGGMALTHVQVQTVYLGSDWQSASLQQETLKLDQFFQYLTKSSFMDLMGEYYEVLPFVGKQYVGRGSFIGHDFTSDSLPKLSSGTWLDDRHTTISNEGYQGWIEYYLSREIYYGRVATPNDWQTLYVVFLPPGVGSYYCQTTNAIGYHGSFFYSTGSLTGHNVTYAVIPYPGQGNPSIPHLTNPFDGQTAVASHELAEAVTDPYWYSLWEDTQYGFRGGIEAGWYQDASTAFPGGCEIGDLDAENYFAKLNGYVVQGLWSAKSSAVLLPSGATPLTYSGGTGSSGSSLESAGTPLGLSAYADSYQLSANAILTTSSASGVLANDYQPYPQYNTLQAILKSNPGHGSLTLKTDGSFDYSPDSGYTGSDSFTYAASDGYFTSDPVTVTVNVSSIATSTTLAAPTSPVASDEPVTLTATVAASGSSRPGGYVLFYDGGSYLGPGALQWNGSANVATLTTLALVPGSHSITAGYQPYGGFGGSTSSVVTVIVASPKTGGVSSASPPDPATGSPANTPAQSAGKTPTTPAFSTGIVAVNPNTAIWYIRGSASAGIPNLGTFVYGLGGWIPLLGDWDGNGNATVGMFDPGTATFYLRNENNAGLPDAGTFHFGLARWKPVVGDWNGDGKDTIGVYDPSTGTFYLRDDNTAGAADAGVFRYGAGGWTPLAGDWNGDGKTTIGVFNPATASFYLRDENSAGAPDAGQFGYGLPGWTPLVGDWNGNGSATVGVYSPSSAAFYLRNSNNSGLPDAGEFAYGLPGWLPLSGVFSTAVQPSSALGSASTNLSDELLQAMLLGRSQQHQSVPDLAFSASG